MHVSSHWPREGTKLVKVAFKTGDTVTQDAAQPHKWTSDQYLWFHYSLLSTEGLDCRNHDQGIKMNPGRGKRHFFCLKHSRPSTLINAYHRLFSLEVKWLVSEAHNTHLHLVLRLRCIELYLYSKHAFMVKGSTKHTHNFTFTSYSVN